MPSPSHLLRKAKYATPRIIFTCITIFLAISLSLVIVVYKHATSNKSYAFTYNCDSNDSSSLTCEQKVYVNIAKNKGVPAAINKLKSSKIAVNNPNGVECHEIAHAIGRQAFVQYKTLASTFAHGSSVCRYGYYHGVMEAAAASVGVAKFDKTFTTLCNTLPNMVTSYNRISCVHGIGHGLMFDNNNDVFKAVNLCDKFAVEEDKNACYGGVFMDNYTDALLYGSNGKYLKPNDLQYPCDAVANQYKLSCYNMQNLYIFDLLDNNYSKISLELCAKETSTYSQNCYENLGSDIINSNHNIINARDTCLTLGQTHQAQSWCVDGALNTLVSYYSVTQAYNACPALQSYLPSNCYNEISYYAKVKKLVEN